MHLIGVIIQVVDSFVFLVCVINAVSASDHIHVHLIGVIKHVVDSIVFLVSVDALPITVIYAVSLMSIIINKICPPHVMLRNVYHDILTHPFVVTYFVDGPLRMITWISK